MAAKLVTALFSNTNCQRLLRFSGDTGKDTITLNGKVNSSTIIDGGDDDDLITTQ